MGGNFYNLKIIIPGFFVVVLLMIATGLFPTFMLKNIALDAENIYKHPFTVSNTTRNLSENIVAIHRDIKDIVMAKSKENVKTIVRSIDLLEANNIEDLKVIEKFYLGPKNDILKIKEGLANWNKTKDKIINLKLSGHTKEAEIIAREEGAEYVIKLNSSLRKIIAFANNKAIEFYSSSIYNRNYSLIIIYTLLGTLLIVALLIKSYIIFVLKKNQTEISKYIYLIDQHINIANIESKTKKISNVTSSLLRLLKLNKNQILGKNFIKIFLANNNKKVNKDLLQTINSGKAWRGKIKNIIDDKDQWLELNIQPETDKNYNLSQYNILVSDATYEKKVEQLSIIDELTGVYNRRKYLNSLEKNIRTAKRSSDFFTLAIADIDFFKSYNDNYGHPEGDLLLKRIVNSLKFLLNRPTDMIFRIGGEEFAILFSSVNKEGTKKFLEKIRKSIERLNIPHAGNPINNCATISIGAKVLLPEESATAHKIYSEADKALYKAKETRNTVVVI